MPTLTIPKNWASFTTPSEGQLDAAKESIETFFNITKIGQDNISDDAVHTSNILDGAVTSDKFQLDAVTTVKLSDDAIQSNHLNSNTINASKLSGQFALAKTAGPHYTISGATTSGPPAGYTSILSCSLATDGRPVLVFIGSIGPNPTYIEWTNGAAVVFFRIVRDGYIIYEAGTLFYTDIATNATTPPTALKIDLPAAGGHLYELQVKNPSGIPTGIHNISMAVVEL